jgi:hypothetical protein
MSPKLLQALTFVPNSVTSESFSPNRGAHPDAILIAGRGRCPRAVSQAAPRAALGIVPAGTTAGAWGAFTGLGQDE